GREVRGRRVGLAATTRALHEAELGDVTTDGRLRDVEASCTEERSQLLLVGDRLAGHDLANRLLPSASVHRGDYSDSPSLRAAASSAPATRGRAVPPITFARSSATSTAAAARTSAPIDGDSARAAATGSSAAASEARIATSSRSSSAAPAAS